MPNLGAGDFNSLARVEDIADPQTVDRPHSNQNRPRTRETNAKGDPGQGIGVIPARFEMGKGKGKIGIVERPKLQLSFRMEQLGGRQPGLGEAVSREITAPLPQVVREIAKNINQLKPFPKTDGIGQQSFLVQDGSRKKMALANLRPKLPDTTRHPISVIIQFGVSPKYRNIILGGAAKPDQVQLLATGDGRENLPNESSIYFGKTLKDRERFLRSFQENFLRRRALLGGQGAEVETFLTEIQNSIPEKPQGTQTPLDRNQLRVCDGIGDTCKQVGQSDLGSNRPRQNSQCFVKRSRDLFQQVGQQRSGLRHHVAASEARSRKLVSRLLRMMGAGNFAKIAAPFRGRLLDDFKD